MPAAANDMIRCNTCGTTYPATDVAEAANHVDHDTEHVDPGA